MTKLEMPQNMNLATLRELKKYLIGGLNANLTELGAIGLDDATVIRALQVGASLEGVSAVKKGSWSPFVRERFPVTENLTPGYDAEDHFEWEVQGAFRGMLKDGFYILPKGIKQGDWENQQTETVHKDSLFEKYKEGENEGRYIYKDLIQNALKYRM